VARSAECDHPAGVESLPVVTAARIDSESLPSGQIDAAVRAAVRDGRPLYALDEGLIRRLAPDLVITQDLCHVCAVSSDEVGRVQSLDAEVLALDPRTLGEVAESVRVVAERLGVPERGAGVAAEMERRIAAAATAVAGAPAVRVFVAEWLDPPFAAGHWLPEMVATAGGIDVLGTAGEPSYPTTWEAVAAASPIKSVAELVAYAKANPEKTNYASSSASFQLVTELFKQKTGAPMQAIPYKSANESVLAVISGQVTTTIADSGPVSGQVKSGTARALAVTSPKRIEDLAEVPTLKEAGADVDAVLWSGIFAPKATPPAVVKKLEGELMRIARLPDVIARLKLLGIDPVGNTSEEFSKILAADIARWGAVAKAANIRMEQ